MITGPADTPVALTLEAPETDASNQNGSNISAGADIPLEPFNGSSGPGDAPQKRSGPPVVPSPKGGGHVGLGAMVLKIGPLRAVHWSRHEICMFLA